MLPSHPVDDIGNRRRRDAEFFSEHFMGMSALGVYLSNFANIGLCQLGSAMDFSARLLVGAMFLAVMLIIAQGIPTQIAKGIIGRNAVIMTGPHPRRAWTSESEKNQNMDTNRIIPPQSYLGITGTRCLAKNPLWFVAQTARAWAKVFPKRSNPSLVTDFVSGESRNSFPNFGGIGKMVFSHGVSLLRRVALRLGPGLLYPQQPGSFFYSISSVKMPEECGQNG